tara:strand:+ start:840 stop:1127 length:288 start_codon:yes stop_codon:yes gene_type:complete
MDTQEKRGMLGVGLVRADMVDYFRDYLKASLSSKGAKEGLLSLCYIEDQIPQSHPEEPSNEDLINMICEDAMRLDVRDIDTAKLYVKLLNSNNNL